MKIFIPLLIGCLITSVALAYQAAKLPAKKEVFEDDNGQRISFELPQQWKFSGGIILDAAGKKAGEFIPGTFAECKYQSGDEYLKELRAGYLDDIGNPRFVGSRTLLIGKTTWTEGIRNIPAWDGKSNTGRWYAHSFFALLNNRCFAIHFYSQQKQLSEEEKFKGILASIKLLQ